MPDLSGLAAPDSTKARDSEVTAGIFTVIIATIRHAGASAGVVSELLFELACVRDAQWAFCFF